ANGVAEGAANGTGVGITATSSDVDGGGVTLTLTVRAGGRFAIDSSTGVVTVADGSLLDYETATSHSITVKAADASGSFTTQTFRSAERRVAKTTLTDANATPNDAPEGAATVTWAGSTATELHDN